MKKGIFLLILSACCLPSCDINLGFFSVGKTKSETSEENGKTPENPEEIDTKTTYTVTIETCGEPFKDVATGYGTQIDTDLESGSAGANKLTNCLRAQVTEAKCLTSTWFKKLNTAEYGSEWGILQFGSGKYTKGAYQAGTLTWNSTAKIMKVEVKAYAFVSSENVDEDAQLNVNGQSFPLFEEGDEAETLKTFSKEFSDGTTSLTLVSETGRAFLKSLTITWEL